MRPFRACFPFDGPGVLLPKQVVIFKPRKEYMGRESRKKARYFYRALMC